MLKGNYLWSCRQTGKLFNHLHLNLFYFWLVEKEVNDILPNHKRWMSEKLQKSVRILNRNGSCQKRGNISMRVWFLIDSEGSCYNITNQSQERRTYYRYGLYLYVSFRWLGVSYAGYFLPLDISMTWHFIISLMHCADCPQHQWSKHRVIRWELIILWAS